MIKKIGSYLSAYLLWTVDLLLAVWLIFISRETFLDFLASIVKEGDIIAGWQARWWDRVFTVLIALLWIVFMTVSEARIRRSVRRGGLLPTFANLTGFLLLLAFIVDVLHLWLQGVAGFSWGRFLVLMIELLGGVGLTIYGRVAGKKIPKRAPEDSEALYY